jgi:hypothetical protein
MKRHRLSATCATILILLFVLAAPSLLAQIVPPTTSVPRLRVGNPTGGLPAAGIVNAEGLKINGVDVASSSDSFWSTSGAGIAYSAGPVRIGPGTASGSAGDLQLSGGTSALTLGTATEIGSLAVTAAGALTITPKAGQNVTVASGTGGLVSSGTGNSSFAGNLGAGVATPLVALDVSSAADSGGWFRFGTIGGLGAAAGIGTRIGYNSNGYGTLYSYDYATSAAKPLYIQEAGGNTVLNPSGGTVVIGAATASSKLDVTTAGLGVTQTTSSGLALVNTTAAAAGAQQISPALRFSGFGWKTNATAASQAVDFRAYVLPVQGAAAPTGNLIFQSSINAGAYSDLLTLSSAGKLTVTTAGAVNGQATFASTDTTGGFVQLTDANGTTAGNALIGTGTTLGGSAGDVVVRNNNDSNSIILRGVNANWLSVNSTAATLAGNLTVSGTGTHAFAGPIQFAGDVWNTGGGTDRLYFAADTSRSTYLKGGKADGTGTNSIVLRSGNDTNLMTLSGDGGALSVPGTGSHVFGTTNTVTMAAGVLTTTGNATVGGDLTVSGTATSTVAGGTAWNAATATTSSVYGNFSNTSGNLVYGLEGSGAGGLYTGTTAYASVIGNGVAKDLQFVTNANVRATITSAGNIGAGTATPSSKLDVTTDGLGVSQTTSSGLALVNTTAAAAGAQQISPALRFSGFGWKTDATAASQAVDFRAYVLPVQGAAAPTGNLIFQSSINGGAYSDLLTLTSAGNGTLVGNLTVSGAGANTFAGDVSVSNASTNGTNYNLINSDTGGATWSIGTAGSASATGDAVGTFYLYQGGATKFALAKTTGNATLTGNLTASSTGTHTFGTTNIVTMAAGVLTATGNISGGNVTTGGLVSATGNITGGNLTTGGLVSATGNVTGGNITTGGLVSATGNVTGGNLTTGGLVSATGDITSAGASGFTTSTIGGTLAVKSGSNAKSGTFTLVAGTVTVSNTSVTANSVIVVTLKTVGGTRGGNPDIVPTASTGFVATGAGTDTSTYNYIILEVN